MKLAQVNKLYKQLTPKELADLTIGATQRRDFDERDLIADSVQRGNYNCLHHDYINRLAGFERIAAYYGVQHWKLLSFVTVGLYRYPAYDELTESAMQVLARFNALEQALIRVCETERIDFDAVKRQASCNVSDDAFALPVCNLEIDGLIDEYITQFMIGLK
jgi:hypothetical protein